MAELIDIKERITTRFLNYYTLEYRNRLGYIKQYEMVSKHRICNEEDLSGRANGVAMIVVLDGRLLLLKEFRMAVNHAIYNLPAGTLDEGENTLECLERELLEETGLHVKKLHRLLPASYSAIDLTNAKAAVAILEAEGELSDQFLTEDEEIVPVLYTKEEAEELLHSDQLSARAQLAVYLFVNEALI